MRFLALSFALIAASCAERPEVFSADLQTQTRISTGSLVGYVDPAGAYVWRAIPFAAPPVDQGRWAAPRPPESWVGLREAITAPTPCVQLANGLSADLLGANEGDLVGQEDCLYLDVYAPPNAENLPVMMWIHGGGNNWGWADQYNGAQLAMDQNVIIVVVQYRMGPLGFFAHEALRDAAETEVDRAANFATLDHIAALNWIQQNISAFGGDADTVTIFGESAGGTNVAALLSSPLAEGLFHRAIIQSGSANAIPLALAEGYEGNEVNAANLVAQRIAGDAVSADALRAASVEDVYAASIHEGGLEVPTMIADGVTVPVGGIMQAFASPDTFNAVPVITGTNRDELKLYNGLDDRFVTRNLGIFFRIRDRDVYDAVSGYQSQMWAINAVDQVAEVMTAGGHDQVWAYRFDWDEGGSNVFLDSAAIFGAMHSMEIPFVFNHFSFFGSRLDPIVFNRENEATRQTLANEMGAYWGRFARQGEPGGNWAPWSQGAARMRFDTSEGEGSQMMPGLWTVETLAQEMLSDPVLSQDQVCQIVASLQGRYFDDGAELPALTGC